MQQRMAIMESILTPDQRQHLASLPFSFEIDRNSEFAQAVQILQRQPADDPDGAVSPLQQQPHHMPVSGAPSLGLSGEQQQQSDQLRPMPVLPLSALTAPQRLDTSAGQAVGADKDAKRVARPLSGLQTKYTFNDRPVHQLPRVFSGDYSAADMDAIETSAELFASVVSASSADSQTVEEIIASKLALEKQQEHQQQHSASELPPPSKTATASPLMDVGWVWRGFLQQKAQAQAQVQVKIEEEQRAEASQPVLLLHCG
ncbi:hypothetical protein DL89DRAFT_56696 [Linderina pennispora]|uniref:Uncharacterized protein n=1 Tax=Linderina pennispora TaxID=61395 RepID=A0A1Y1W1A6_9FUNG|nr:uncharacterized protein DL89DRAFT_56696 [Linderina pennispora]ORX67319.1 hypothetical protein DL89DRAFT_56696 [Linderina pennispora]